MVTKTNFPLLREVPVIRRAREFHLYDNTGRRFLDLYLNNGKAILGHRPEGFSLILKNTLSRGVYAEYPSHEEGKMLKAAKALWGETFPHIRYYHSLSLLQERFREKGESGGIGETADPALGKTGTVSLWRPWISPSEETRIILPVLPVPGMERGVIVCASSSDLPEGELPSAVSAAGINRCLWNMKSLLDRTPVSPIESMENLPDFAGWTRRGPYLQWQGEDREYGELFRKALSAGILLPPDPVLPAVLPHILTSGDRKVLDKFFRGKGE